MSNEVTIHERRDVAELPIQGMNDLAQLGNFIAQSGMLGANSPAAGMVIATTCIQERMSLLEFGRRYHVDNRGKVTMRSDRMLAEFKALGGKCKWITKLSDTTRQAALVTFEENEDVEVEFTYEEAKAAGYIKPGSNWEKDPAAQMRARVITRFTRAICPQAVAGIYGPEEMQDVYNSEPEPQAAEPVAADIPTAATITVQSEATPFDEPDYNACPIPGNEFTGKRWADIPHDQLKIAHGLKHATMEDGHRQAINAILEAKQ